MKKFYTMCSLATVTVGCAFNASASFTDVYYTISNPANTPGGQYNGTSGYQDLDSLNVKFGVNSYSGIFSGGIYITQPTSPASQNDSTMPENYLTVCTDFLGTLYLGKTYKYSDPASPFTTVLSTQNGQTGAVDTSGTFQFLSTSANYTALNGYVTAYLSGLNGGYNNTGYLLQPDPLNSAQGNSDGQLPQELLMGSSIIQQQGNPSPVPEPTTVFAAASLLLPLGASTLRILRRK
jgi:hypothetical protein